MMKRTFLLIFFVFLSLSGCKKKRNLDNLDYLDSFKSLAQDAVTIVFSTNLEGYVEPCGCTSDPLGGIPRFSQIFSDVSLSQKKPLLLIDTGNLLFESQTRNDADLCQDEARIDLLLSSLKDLRLNFTLKGMFDYARGENFYKSVLAKYSIQSLEATSLLIKTLSHQGMNIAFVITPEETSLESEASLKERIEKEIKKLKEKPRLIVAISRFDLGITKNVFEGLSKSVDVVLQAKSDSMVPNTPLQLNDGPLVIFGGRQGQYFTSITMQTWKQSSEKFVFDNRLMDQIQRKELLESRIKGLQEQMAQKNKSKNEIEFLNKRIAFAKSEMGLLNKKPESLNKPNITFQSIPINRKVESIPALEKKLKDYNNAIPALVKKCEENITCPAIKDNEPHYVGVNVCKGCHQQAYEVWEKARFIVDAKDENGKPIKREIGHSKAWKTLTDINKDNDRSCIGCHSVGFMEKGGYCKSSEVDFRINVQCEVCHGPGSQHAQTQDKKFIRRRMSEEGCRGCHHVPHIPTYESFNYEEKLIKILGKGHGENLLKELMHHKK